VQSARPPQLPSIVEIGWVVPDVKPVHFVPVRHIEVSLLLPLLQLWVIRLVLQRVWTGLNRLRIRSGWVLFKENNFLTSWTTISYFPFFFQDQLLPIVGNGFKFVSYQSTSGPQLELLQSGACLPSSYPTQWLYRLDSVTGASFVRLLLEDGLALTLYVLCDVCVTWKRWVFRSEFIWHFTPVKRLPPSQQSYGYLWLFSKGRFMLPDTVFMNKG
jgi:hypothetical protein